ncbi:alpha/beta-hydrolase [Fomes fomentarius]|nr:alpha/beta-hydrolase [Fomes fomentarius]
MPTIPVNKQGAVMHYEDSGAPSESNDYATLVIVHGAGFHGASFRPLVPFAAEHKLRLIIPSLRDYPGSTPYTKEELDDLRGVESGRQEKALRARASELVAFLTGIVESEGIPPIHPAPGSNAPTGGISLVSWSAGNCQTMALFAYADQFPEADQKLLGAYLRTYVLYEPSLASTGGSVPEALQAIKATREAAMSLDDLTAAFSTSVSAYYPPFTFPDAIHPDPRYTPRTALHEHSNSIDWKFTPTTSRMTCEELRDMLHSEPIDTDGSQSLLRRLNPAIYSQNMERALLDRRLVGGNEILPHLRIHVVWCDMSVGECVWASVLLHFRHAEAQEEWRRPMELHKLEQANHFVHWEEPERFVKMLVDMIY